MNRLDDSHSPTHDSNYDSKTTVQWLTCKPLDRELPPLHLENLGWKVIGGAPDG